MTKNAKTHDVREVLSDAEIVDQWWTSCGDEWAIPESVMIQFAHDIIRRTRPYGTVPAEQISDAKVHAAYEAFVAGPVDAHASMRVALEAAREVRNAAHCS